MKSIFVIFCALFLLIAMPWVFQSLNNAETDEITQSFAGITTSPGEYSANFTLPDPLWKNTRASVTEISSNVTADTPSAFAYNTVSHLLVVSGLDQSTVRTLSVTYLINSETLDANYLIIIAIFRWFYIFIILGTSVGAVYAFFTS